MNIENDNKFYFYTEDLKVGYAGKQILDPIKIGIQKGEILTLVGPNGAGKSTILKSIAVQLSPIGGAVYLDGENLFEMRGNDRARKMSVMFTDSIHADWMTCRDVVAAGRYPYTGKFGVLSEKDWTAVDEAMELVKVYDLKERDFQTLSDGQRQRVLLARALCQEPDILLLDEPTSYLDIRYRLEFMSLLQEMAHRKKTAVILSIHEIDMAMRVSDWVLCVGSGNTIRFGRPYEVLKLSEISKLFGVEEGRFFKRGGSMELVRPDGNPRVFVFAGGGSGTSVFWRLQREGIAFAVGILSEGDLDYPTACTLASVLISVPPFEEISADKKKEAMRWLETCQSVIACRRLYGGWAVANDELLEYAEKKGKKIEYI